MPSLDALELLGDESAEDVTDELLCGLELLDELDSTLPLPQAVTNTENKMGALQRANREEISNIILLITYSY